MIKSKIQIKVFWAESRYDLEKQVNEFCETVLVRDVSYSVCPKQIGQVHGDVICSYHCAVVYETYGE